MKIKRFAATLAAAATLLVTSNTAMAQSGDRVQFICREGFDRVTNERIPTTYAWTQRGKISIIRWTSTLGARGEWTPERRCQAVSPRFQSAYENGSLKYLTNGMMNGQRVICTAKEKRGDCEDLLLTLRPEDNSMALLRQFNDILKGRAGSTIRQSTGEDQVYIEVDLEQFLNTAPVE